MGNRLKDQRGLTLIELLAVIVILGIIAAIAIPSIGGIINKSKNDAVEAEAIQVLNAAKLYVSSNNVTADITATNTTAELNQFLDNPGTYSITIDFTANSTTGPTIDYKDITVTKNGITKTFATDEALLAQ